MNPSQQPGPSPETVHQSADVDRVLAEFEHGLESLKKLYTQRQELQASLHKHEEALRATERALAERREELNTLSAALDTKTAELEARSQAVDRQAEALEAQARAIEEATRALEARQAEHQTNVETKTRELSSLEATLSARDAFVKQTAEALERERASLDDRSAHLGNQSAEILSLRDELAQARSTLADQQAQRQAMTERLAALESEAASRHAERQSLATTLEETQRKLEAQTKLAEELLSRAEGLERDLSASRAQAEELAAEGTLASRQRLAGMLEVVEEYEALWETERRECVRVTRDLTTATQDLTELEDVLGTLRERLKAEIQGKAELVRRADEAQAVLESRESDLEALQAQVRELQERASNNACDISVREWVDRRRRRLSLVQKLSRERTTKLRKAGEALTTRFEQCEQVLAQRAELAGIRNRLIDAERRQQRAKATSKVGVVMLCAVAILAILGGLSYALAREVAPSTFIASSQIAADGRGRELSLAELEEWQRFHEGLLKDPMFHQAAAERFRRQGMGDLGSPSAVANLVREQLSIESIRAGQMDLHLKAAGSERTRRTLETLTAALAGEANAAQQRRIDGGVTNVSRAAATGDAPIDNTRMIWALVIMGAAAMVILCVSIGLWRKLARAKTSFEMDGQLEAALEDAKWSEFAKTIR